MLHTQSIWLDPIPCAAPLPGPQNLSSVCYPSSPAQDSLRGWGSKFNPKWYFFFFFFPLSPAVVKLWEGKLRPRCNRVTLGPAEDPALV